MPRKPSRRLKASSKYGQSTQQRANESSGSRKAELEKISRVDKQNFKNAPKAVQKRIIRDERAKKSSRVREDNSGMFI